MADDENEPENEEYLAAEDVDMLTDGSCCESSSGDSDHPVSEEAEYLTPPQDDALKVLNGHKESVFCVTIDPTHTYVASGGQDHVSIVWDVRSGNPVFRADGHQDSVICVSFSPDGSYLATGDMAGGVQVWHHKPDRLEPSWTLIRSETVGDLSFLLWWQPPPMLRSKSPIMVLAAGDMDGLVTVWSVSLVHGAQQKAKYLAGLSGMGTTGALYHLPSIHSDSPKLIVLYQNGELCLWDIRSEQIAASARLVTDTSSGLQAQQQPSDPVVFCLVCPPDKPNYTPVRDRELVVIGGHGTIYGVHVKQQQDNSNSLSVIKCIATVDCQDDGSVESIDFSHTHPYFAFGTVNGTIGIVDSTRLCIRQKWTYVDNDNQSSMISITCLRWSHKQPVFFTSTTNGAVIAWPGLTDWGRTENLPGSTHSHPTPLRIWWGHQAMILDLALPPVHQASSTSNNGDTFESFIASASDDATVRMFALNASSLCASSD